MDENKIINTPYDDRYCGNCLYRKNIESNAYLKCVTNNCYVSYNRWCPMWAPEYRVYKFEN